MTLTQTLNNLRYAIYLSLSVMAMSACQAEYEPNTKTQSVNSSNNPANSTPDTLVNFETNLGTFTVSLNNSKAPISVANFVQYVNDGFYNNTIFHRVIDGFMVQGGGFDENMLQKQTLQTIQNEANNGLKNSLGTLAMARTNSPHSATSQFFINTADNAFLNHTSETGRGWGYAVFGKVTQGIDIIKAMNAVQTATKNGHQNVPVDNIIIKNASVVK